MTKTHPRRAPGAHGTALPAPGGCGARSSTVAAVVRLAAIRTGTSLTGLADESTPSEVLIQRRPTPRASFSRKRKSGPSTTDRAPARFNSRRPPRGRRGAGPAVRAPRNGTAGPPDPDQGPSAASRPLAACSARDRTGGCQAPGGFRTGPHALMRCSCPFLSNRASGT